MFWNYQQRRLAIRIISDLIIKGESDSADCESICESVEAESSPPVTTVSRLDLILMLIECKKTVSASLVMLEANDLIEMLIYCRYILDITNQKSIIGILTDCINWHCFYIKRNEKLMEIYKYVTFSSKDDYQIITTVTKLIS